MLEFLKLQSTITQHSKRCGLVTTNNEYIGILCGVLCNYMVTWPRVGENHKTYWLQYLLQYVGKIGGQGEGVEGMVVIILGRVNEPL